ncbi:MAG: NlpC/P60 family protein [Glaciihabitans sp.]|nr:NlpC/P60 family protein [Glaciihabitans sp.]
MQDPNTPEFPTEFHTDVIPPAFSKPANFRRKANLLSVAVSAIVVPGLFATLAIPAYGAALELSPVQRTTASEVQHVRVKAQTLTTTATLATSIHRDSFGATSNATLASRHVMAAGIVGPSLRSFLANPPYPKFSLSQVVSVAKKYLGVPYVFGGESPAGFDCSGLTAYVYAQFGVALPHSAAAQGRLGKTIARSAAQPGDVVVMDGGAHVGIYAGGGRMIDAPEPGRAVSERAIYDNNYYIVRFGI